MLKKDKNGMIHLNHNHLLTLQSHRGDSSDALRLLSLQAHVGQTRTVLCEGIGGHDIRDLGKITQQINRRLFIHFILTQLRSTSKYPSRQP